MTAYDAENHLVGAGWNFGAPAVDYAYDAQGKRSFLWTAGTFDPWGGNATNYSVVMYSPSGQKLGTYLISVCNQGANNTTSLTICSALSTSDKYFGGRRLAVMDQLGSAGTYYPWGEAKGSTNPQDAWSYATYWRDSVSGLDYANQRYYSNTYGRFMTPDPYKAVGGASGNPRDPQSWNRYAYVNNDPVNFTDPKGLYPCPAGPPGPDGQVDWTECEDVTINLPFNPNPNFSAAMQAYMAALARQIVVSAETAFIQQAVKNASSLLLDKDCAGLFLTPDQNTSDNRTNLANELAQDDSDFGLLQSGMTKNQDPNVPAFTVGGFTWIVEGGAFFSGQAQRTDGSYGPLGGFAQGLSLSAFDNLTIVHEFMHQLGIVGEDNKGQTYTLPNGDTATGSAGISQEVRDKCLK